MRIPALQLRGCIKVVSALLLTGLLGWAPSIDLVSSEGERSGTVKGARSLAVEVENGSVDVVQDASATTMQVRAEIRCMAQSKAKADARVKATVLKAECGPDGRAMVSVRFPPPERIVDPQGGGTTMTQDSVRLTIRCSSLDGVRVRTENGAVRSGAFKGEGVFQTSNGAVEVQGHAGPITLESGNGALKARGVTGPVHGRSSNGAIEVSLTGSSSNVDLETSNGAIDLRLPSGWQGQVSADTTNGKLTLDGGPAARDVQVHDGEGSMVVGAAPKATAKVQTTNGRIGVRVGGGG